MDVKSVFLHTLKRTLELEHAQQPTMNSISKVFVNDFFDCFAKFLEWGQSYPLLRSQIHEQMRTIFTTMPDICVQESDLSYVCDVCDVEIQIKNNDHQYSYEMHEQSLEHLNALNNFHVINIDGKFKSKGVSSTSKNDAVDNIHKREEAINIQEPTCVVYNTSGKRMCVLCGVMLPDPSVLTSHMNGRLHKKNVAQKNARTKPSSCITSRGNNIDGKFKSKGVSSTSKYNTVDNIHKREKAVNIQEQTCVVYNTSGKRMCVLCGVMLPDPSVLTSHMNGRLHKKNVAQNNA